MALTRQEKAQQIALLKEKMSSSTSTIFAHFIGLKVSEVSELRRKLKEKKAEMKVAKKTLMQIAAKETKWPELPEEILPGPVACIFSMEDPLVGASIAFGFSKDHPQVALLGGFFEGKFLRKEEALALAKMPSREVLLSMFVSMIHAPLRSFASLCGTPLRSFALALSELAKKRA